MIAMKIKIRYSLSWIYIKAGNYFMKYTQENNNLLNKIPKLLLNNYWQQ